MRPTRIRDKKMKKVFLILVAIIGFGFSANAQQFRDFYSDGKITAQIRDVYIGSICDKFRSPKNLVIKNKTNHTITVTGIIKVEFTECPEFTDFRRLESEQRFEITIEAGEEERVDNYFRPNMTNRRGGFNQTLKFWIDEIDGKSPSSSSSYGKSQSGSVPNWIVGKWGNFLMYLCTINTSGITWHDGKIADFVRIEGDIAWFKWREDQTLVRITKISNNELHYHNPTTGSAYALRRY